MSKSPTEVRKRIKQLKAEIAELEQRFQLKQFDAPADPIRPGTVKCALAVSNFSLSRGLRRRIWRWFSRAQEGQSKGPFLYPEVPQ